MVEWEGGEWTRCVRNGVVYVLVMGLDLRGFYLLLGNFNLDLSRVRDSVTVFLH